MRNQKINDAVELSIEKELIESIRQRALRLELY